MEQKLKHLEFIQAVITRMASNSFLLKGWSVVLISALFALSSANSNPAFIFLAYIPAIMFWGLDGYFLWEEKKFRALYDHVRKLDNADIDFSMNTTLVPDVKKKSGTWFSVVMSQTLIPFHGVLTGTIVIVMFLKSCS